MEPTPAPLTPMGARTSLAHPALYAVIACLSVIIIVGALWVFWPQSVGTPEPSASPSETPTVTAKNFQWRGISFEYPVDWTAKIMTYRSPAQQAAGEKPDEVGFTVFKTSQENDASGRWLITAGGPQSAGRTCTDEPATACAIYRDDSGLNFPYYTNSTDAATLAVFATIRHQIIPGGTAYRNTDYGFAVDLPSSWSGFTVTTRQADIFDFASSRRIGAYPEITIHHPLANEENPRQGIPVMIFTIDQWERILREEYNVSAAPFPPGELARNSKYVFALPPRYNYSLSTGWEEVEQIIRSRPVIGFER